LIESNSTAYANEEFIYNKTLPHIIKHIGDNSLILFDSCKAHLSERIKILLASHSIKYIVIPGGTTCLVQLVDHGIRKMVKNEIKTEFESWCFKEFKAMPKGKRKKTFEKPSNKNIAKWIIKSCAKLPSEFTRNAFIETILSKEMQKNIILKQIPKYFVDTKIEIDYLHNDEDEETMINEEKENDEDYSGEEDSKNEAEKKKE